MKCTNGLAFIHLPTRFPVEYAIFPKELSSPICVPYCSCTRSSCSPVCMATCPQVRSPFPSLLPPRLSSQPFQRLSPAGSLPLTLWRAGSSHTHMHTRLGDPQCIPGTALCYGGILFQDTFLLPSWRPASFSHCPQENPG